MCPESCLIIVGDFDIREHLSKPWATEFLDFIIFNDIFPGWCSLTIITLRPLPSSPQTAGPLKLPSEKQQSSADLSLPMLKVTCSVPPTVLVLRTGWDLQATDTSFSLLCLVYFLSLSSHLFLSSAEAETSFQSLSSKDLECLCSLAYGDACPASPCWTPSLSLASSVLLEEIPKVFRSITL